ncbi:MAG: BadF/BadG/BcrA/BcrD ATPase family protein [bacterium]|jgi:N-acetylglucosamine kinase-like BadF-type ATPase|nr:BadF/BadG/BcrA/BcrD ATPase family protein [bacterium]
MPYVFGVDGGASTCRAVLITDAGQVVFIGRGPGVNYHEVGAVQAVSIIKRLFEEALKQAHARPEECLGMCFGLAGVSRDQDHKLLSGVLDPVFGAGKYLLTHDAKIALLSGALAEIGIIVISGTGSIVYGRDRDGLEARVGGYGPLVSDDASGYRLGLEGIRTVLRTHDGVVESNAMVTPIMTHLGMKSVEDLVHWINTPGISREKIASVAPFVIQAAMDDDPIAYDMIQEQADRIALGVESVYRRLNLPERIDVVLSGGIFNNFPKFCRLIQRKIRYLVPGACAISPKLDPVLGAAFFAFDLAGFTVDDDLLDIVRRTYLEYKENKDRLEPFSLGDDSVQEKHAPLSEPAPEPVEEPVLEACEPDPDSDIPEEPTSPLDDEPLDEETRSSLEPLPETKIESPRNE